MDNLEKQNNHGKTKQTYDRPDQETLGVDNGEVGPGPSRRTFNRRIVVFTAKVIENEPYQRQHDETRAADN